MVLTQKTLDRYLAQHHQTISKETRQRILDYFSEEPGDGHAWTEQDLWEEVQKQIRCFDREIGGA